MISAPKFSCPHCGRFIGRDQFRKALRVLTPKAKESLLRGVPEQPLEEEEKPEPPTVPTVPFADSPPLRARVIGEVWNRLDILESKEPVWEARIQNLFAMLDERISDVKARVAKLEERVAEDAGRVADLKLKDKLGRI